MFNQKFGSPQKQNFQSVYNPNKEYNRQINHTKGMNSHCDEKGICFCVIIRTTCEWDIWLWFGWSPYSYW